jgi:putative salt-induced outer membrane protein
MAGAALAAAVICLPAVHAEETEPGLNGRVGFSFAEARGNSDTLAIVGETTMEYVTDSRWLYDAKLGFVMREESEVTTEERYEARFTANYFWTPDNYLYGRLEWRKDNFGGVREEWVPSVGYGRVILSSDRHSLKGELGAGYRFADLADGTSEEGGVLSGGIRYAWKISEATSFFQNVGMQWSDDNTFVESETGLSTNLIGNLAARFSYRIRRNSDVPEGLENSDFMTTVGLEYKF